MSREANIAFNKHLILKRVEEIQKGIPKYDPREDLLRCIRKKYFNEPQFLSYTPEERDDHWNGVFADTRKAEVQRCENVKCVTNTKGVATDFRWLGNENVFVCNVCGVEQKRLVQIHRANLYGLDFMRPDELGGTWGASHNQMINVAGNDQQLTDLAIQANNALKAAKRQRDALKEGGGKKMTENEKAMERQKFLLDEVEDCLSRGKFIRPDDLRNGVVITFLDLIESTGHNTIGLPKKGLLAVITSYYALANGHLLSELHDKDLHRMFGCEKTHLLNARKLLNTHSDTVEKIRVILPRQEKNTVDIFIDAKRCDHPNDMNNILTYVKDMWNLPSDSVKLITISYYYMYKHPVEGLKKYGKNNRKPSVDSLTKLFKRDGKFILKPKDLQKKLKDFGKAYV